MNITENNNPFNKVIKNRTIMDYAIEFSVEEQKSDEILVRINYARIHKKIIIEYELVEMNGDKNSLNLDNCLTNAVLYRSRNF